MPRNNITTSDDVAADPAPAAAGPAFPDASVPAASRREPTGVAAEFDALVEAVARDNGVTVVKGNILSVTLANGTVKVEYVDRSVKSVFEPDPIRVVISPTK